MVPKMNILLETGQTLVINVDLYVFVLSSTLLASLTLFIFKALSKHFNFLNRTELDNLKSYQVGIGFLSVVALIWLSLFNGFRIEDEPVEMGSTITKMESEKYIPLTPSQIEAANHQALTEERTSTSKDIDEENLTQDERYERLVDKAVGDLKERWFGDEEERSEKRSDSDSDKPD